MFIKTYTVCYGILVYYNLAVSCAHVKLVPYFRSLDQVMNYTRCPNSSLSLGLKLLNLNIDHCVIHSTQVWCVFRRL